MTILSKIKDSFERILSEIYTVRPHEINQQVSIDCLKPRSKKNRFECKNCRCTNFVCVTLFVLKYSPFGGA